MMILAGKTMVSAVRPPSMVKTTLFGAIIAIVSCCYKGMTASEARRACGRAVNQGGRDRGSPPHPEISVIK